MTDRNKRKGFTLAELLVVVAIIAVLVAIAIPIFTSQLEKSREATDAANIRSQYAQVMTDAITDGGDVNGQIEYGAIELKQKKDNWQDTELGNNLHGLFQEIVGDYPKAGGTAWVEYKVNESKVILHYEGEGSNSGSSSGGSTGDGSSSGSTGSVNFDSLAIDWDKDVKPLNEYSIQIGEIYKSNGNYYIGTCTYEMDKWKLENQALEGDLTNWGTVVKFTGKIWDISDFAPQRTDVNKGDLCKTNDGYYTYIDGGNTTNGPIDSNSQRQWIKVNIK